MSDTQTSFDEKLEELLDHLVIKKGSGPNGSGGEIRYWDNGVDISAKAAIKQLVLDDVIGEDERHDNGVKMVHDPASCMDCTNPDPRFCRNSFRSEQRLIVKGKK